MSDQQSFIVTARKWRPLTFADVVGQEHVTTTLKNAIASGRVHHAYLFTGPRGVGKTTCARILSRALNCQHPVDNEPCNRCSSCLDVLEGRSVDVIEIDGASNNSVDDIRKLRDNAKYAPLTGQYKLYIIDEVHMLSTAAFNALLKTLEEPPPHLIFVFATTEIHKVPATILSRCQRFDFRRMEVESIVNHLGTIAAADGITIDESALTIIARKADGSMRDSQSIFDQVVSYCGTTISGAAVADALHLIDTEFFFQLSDAARAGDVREMFSLASQVVQRGYDLQDCLLGLLEHYRNILTVLTTGSTDLIDGSAQEREHYQTAASDFNQADVVRAMNIIVSGEAVLRQHPPQPRVRFEFTLVQLAQMDSSVDLGELLQRLSGKGAAPVGGVTVALKTPALKAPAVKVGARPAPMKREPVSSLSSGNLTQRWEHVLQELPEHLAFVRSTLRQGLLTADLTEVGIVLRPSAEVIHQRLADKLTDLKQHLQSVYGASVGVQLMPPGMGQPPTDRPAVASESPGLLPIEEAVIELFNAKQVPVFKS